MLQDLDSWYCRYLGYAEHLNGAAGTDVGTLVGSTGERRDRGEEPNGSHHGRRVPKEA